ncbi:MAG: zinc transporter ZupT [Aureispira sp.]|nr:zinc transporter ZupT [Aureispira sp.]
MDENFYMAFTLTVLAGLSTGIGGLIAFFIKKHNTKPLTIAMGFAAGVMLYVSFMEIFPAAIDSLTHYFHSSSKGNFWALVAFFAGMFLVALIDKLIPSHENPHEFHEDEDELDSSGKSPQQKRLMKIGVLTALALAIHNFPEGLATFVSALEDPTLGITIAVAIALHNIPEGIAVAMPIYYASGNRKQAFWYSFLSGVVEPIGALVGYLILMPFLNEMTMSLSLAGVAGIMVFISLDQLLPAAEEYGDHHLSIYGVVAGMMVMAVSLLLLTGGHAHTH